MKEGKKQVKKGLEELIDVCYKMISKVSLIFALWFYKYNEI